MCAAVVLVIMVLVITAVTVALLLLIRKWKRREYGVNPGGPDGDGGREDPNVTGVTTVDDETVAPVSPPTTNVNSRNCV